MGCFQLYYLINNLNERLQQLFHNIARTVNEEDESNTVGRKKMEVICFSIHNQFTLYFGSFSSEAENFLHHLKI